MIFMAQTLQIKDDVIRLIVNGDWEDVLLTLTNDMDPWDIDLIKLNERFKEYLLKTKEMDLRIPAKILLSAAIIYRLKVETLGTFKEEFFIENKEEIVGEPNGRKMITIPPIAIPVKRMPKRSVTINELFSALKKAMVIKERREVRNFFEIELNREDITEKIEELFERIINFLQKTDKITFSLIIKGVQTKEEMLRVFNSLLHLLNQERILCDQEQLFGEIYISQLS